MSSDAIADEYENWKALVDQLKDVEHAPAAARELEQALSSVTSSIAFERGQLAELDRTTEKEKHEWETLHHRNHTATVRVWTKLKHPVRGGRRLSMQEEAEHAAYDRALAGEQRCKERIFALEEQHGILAARLTALHAPLDKYAAVRAALDALYARVFRGREGEFPLEEGAEESVRVCEARERDARTALASHSRIRALTTEAHECLAMALSHMESARVFSTVDVRGNTKADRHGSKGQYTADMVERNEMTTAQMFLHRADALLHQAFQTPTPTPTPTQEPNSGLGPAPAPGHAPDLDDMPHIELPLANFLLDIFFDHVHPDEPTKIITDDSTFCARVADATDTLARAEEAMRTQLLPKVHERYRDAVAEKRAAVRDLEAKRARLERVRRTIMEEVGRRAKEEGVLPRRKGSGVVVEVQGW